MARKNSLLYCLLSVAVFSCTPDKGTYNYEKLNEVAISGIQEEYDVNRFTELNINTNLEFSLDKNEDNFEYLWYMYTIGNEEIDTISREKNLKYTFNTLPAKYSVVYKVTDKKKDVYYHKNFSIRVINTIDAGFMLLGAMSDSINISMVNDSGILSQDMYKGMKGKYLDKNPEGIYHFVPTNKGWYTGREYITVVYDGGRASLFDPINFIEVANEKDMFVLAPNVIKIEGYNAGYYHGDILINAGKINMRRYYVPYDVALEDDALGYEASTISLSGGSFLGFYDNLNRRFMTKNSAGTGVMTMNKTKKSKPFDIHDVKMDLIAGRCLTSGFSGALFKDDNGVYNVASYILRTESEETKMQFTTMSTIASTAELNSAKQVVFALENSVDDMLFFKENSNIIYHYDIMNVEENELLTLDANLVIKKIFYANNMLAIGYEDKNITSGRKCGIIVYNIEKTDNIVMTKKYQYSRLTERIVDIAYKYSTI